MQAKTAQRCLRPKRLRAKLWYDADGKCRSCGEDLPVSWHADHVIPFVISKMTNVQDMQALCPACNRRKGRMGFRAHQQELTDFCKRIQAKVVPLPKFICIECICGGGKSILAVILAFWMIKVLKVADKICWVVPNGSLREQAAEAFGRDKWINKLLGHFLEVCESDNSENPSKGTAGYIVTYHALCANISLHQAEFRRHRYILIADEFHHLAKDSAWGNAVLALQPLSALTMLMTGYLGRSDGTPLILVPYGIDRHVDTRSNDTFRWIRYGLRDGLRERAIIKVHFDHADGAARWKDASGEDHDVMTLGISRGAIFTALKTEYSDQLLLLCADDYLRHKEKRNPRAKMLVVCATVLDATRAVTMLKSRPGLRIAIATYKEEVANETIRIFRTTDDLDVLVTVAKAYEGLDVQAITHIAVLTHIRAPGWILQNIARGWRFDEQAGDWQQQIARIFLPDDALMKACIEEIASEVQRVVREERGGNPLPRNGGNGSGFGPDPDEDIVPLSSTVVAVRSSELQGASLDHEDTAIYSKIIREMGLPLSQVEVQDIHRRLLGFTTPEPTAPPSNAVIDPDREHFEPWNESGWGPDWPATARKDLTAEASVLPRETPGRRIKATKTAIQKLIERIAAGDTDRIKSINGDLLVRFGKRRSLGEKELDQILRHLRTTYANPL